MSKTEYEDARIAVDIAMEHVAYLNRKAKGKPSWRRKKERLSGRRTYRIPYTSEILVPEDETEYALYMGV